MNLNTGTRCCNAGTLRTMVRENSMCKFRPYLPGSTLTKTEILTTERYGHKTLYTLNSKTLLGFSDFIPAKSAADWTTWEDWGSGGRGRGSGGGGGVCVFGGGGA